MTGQPRDFFRGTSWKDGLLTFLTVVGCVGCSARLVAQDAERLAVRQRGPAGVRTAKCLIKIHGVEYLHDFCAFIPGSTQDGSFTIATFRVEAKVVVSAPASKRGVAYWNGPSRKGAATTELGPVHSEGACWTGDPKGASEIRLCAWSTLAADRPTPSEPRTGIVYFGMRDGMYDAIVSSEGMDTDHARIITKKSHDAAIIFCRGQYDFTAECIEDSFRGSPTPILTADCPAGKFSYALRPGPCDRCEPPKDLKFLGKGPKGDGGPNYIIESPGPDGPDVMDGSFASTYDIALSAFAALCPKTLENAGPAPK